MAVKKAGAVSAGYIVLRLPWEVNPLFQEWLQAHFPERAKRVMNRLRDMHSGKEYDPIFGQRMHGKGVWAELIRQRFEKAAKRIGIGTRLGRFNRLDTSRFHAPVELKARNVTPQMDLF